MSAPQTADTTRARIQYLIAREDRARVGAAWALDGPIALAVSDYDGAHTGHAAFARRAAALAEARGARLVALLPWPSPAGGDNTAAPRLTTLEERLARLRALGLFAEIAVVPAPAEPLTGAEALDRLRALGD